VRTSFALQQNDLGVQLVNGLLKTAPRSPLAPSLMVEVAKAQQRSGKLEQAKRTLVEVVARYPQDPFAHEARRQLTALEAGSPAAPLPPEVAPGSG
jgi:TolA-binding protein